MDNRDQLPGSNFFKPPEGFSGPRFPVILVGFVAGFIIFLGVTLRFGTFSRSGERTTSRRLQSQPAVAVIPNQPTGITGRDRSIHQLERLYSTWGKNLS